MQKRFWNAAPPVPPRASLRPRRRTAGGGGAGAGAATEPQAGSSRRSPARRIIAFCSFSKARTSIWRTRSRETP